MDETYAAVDRELRAYSQAANRNDMAEASAHRIEADRLSAEARTITAQMTNAAMAAMKTTQPDGSSSRDVVEGA